MAKFRKRPVVVDAMLFTGENYEELYRWRDSFGGVDRVWPAVPKGVLIPTLEGDHLASPGDVVIRGVAGEFYPCKPEIFERTYEEVVDGDAPDELDGWERVTRERRRQVEEEGFDGAHDGEYRRNELERAAYCYEVATGPEQEPPSLWPWAVGYWKPKDRLRNLERAGALYLAEADRVEDMRYATEHLRLLGRAVMVARAIDALLCQRAAKPCADETPLAAAEVAP